MEITKEQFLRKYPKPNNCPIPIEEWTHSLGYCWSYAQTVDEGNSWDELKNCPCEFLKPTQ